MLLTASTHVQVVAPKKIKLAEAEAILAVQMEKLNAKRAELKGVSCGGGWGWGQVNKGELPSLGQSE